MVKRWIVNASPIIALARIDCIYLLSELCDELFVPQGVADEIQQGGYDDAAVTWINREGKQFLKPMDIIHPLVANWDLGLGESYVLSQAIQYPDSEVILDDRAARKAASVLKIPVRGTLGVILLAKQSGLLSSARTEFEKLAQSGFRIRSDILLKLLELTGE